MDVNVNRLARLQPSCKECQKKEKRIDLVQNKELKNDQQKLRELSLSRRLKRYNERYYEMSISISIKKKNCALMCHHVLQNDVAFRYISEKICQFHQ